MFRVLIPALSLFASGCAVLGEAPSGARFERILGSSQYDRSIGAFRNPDPKFSLGGRYWAIMKEAVMGTQRRQPSKPLPEVKPDIDGLLAASEPAFIWLGHSTFLIRLEGRTIAVDPVLGPYASPVPIFGKRYQPALLTGAAFPKIDVVVISHDHYDHLEMATVQKLAENGTQFVVPLGVGSHLERWGISAEMITELDWWDTKDLNGLRLTCAPSQHFSGRRGMDNNTLWAGWVIQGESKKIFYSGDTGYSSHFVEIGKRLGPFDLSFFEDGQYDLKWPAVHLMPEEAVKAHQEVRGGVMVPVHWGAYELSFHDWFDPAERTAIEAARVGVDLLTPKLGQLVRLGSREPSSTWWRETPDFIEWKKERE